MNSLNKKILILIIIVAALIFGSLMHKNNTSKETIVVDKEWVNQMKELTKNEPAIYLQNENYLDLDNQVIVEVSNKLISESETPREYADNVLSYIDNNIRYDFYEDDKNCFDGTAPSIINKGTGQCDTQSIVAIALLRKANIPARVVGGCILRKTDCTKFLSVFAPENPKYHEMININVTGPYSRGETFSRMGGLHAYPQAMLPENNDLKWFTLEATTGKFADTNCYGYYPEIENATTKKDICVSNSYDYAKACATDDVNELNTYGGAYAQ